MELQPLLHDLLVAVAAPSQAWSGPDGQIRAGAQGVYDGDLRVLSHAVLTVAGREPELVAGGPAGPGAVEVVCLLRGVDGPGADPTLRLRRRRVVTPGTVTEHLRVEAGTAGPVRVPLRLEVGADLAEMEAVKGGALGPALAAEAVDGHVTWTSVAGTSILAAPGAALDLHDPCRPVLTWTLDVHPGSPVEVSWEVASHVVGAVVLPAREPAPWASPVVRGDDRRLPALVDRALADLDSLRLRAAFAPDDTFLAAGAPWFFTLFGRDALWAARMMLPLGTELAGGTLRTLAARQGTRTDPDTAEQPGKILHEVRSKELPLGEAGGVLPPLYYGTVDATPLWICLLHDAWRWGMPVAEVEALLPAMLAALDWMADHGDADGDGFLEYLDVSGHGLANQGWKDSGDSVQWRDGRLADGPIALCEVQGYAHEAALGAAALLDAFDRPGAVRWRAWAGRLAQRFREQFWVDGPAGRHPAIALDAAKRPVDSLTSNIGHLLGTGLLDADEEARVAALLGSALLDSGYGLRTLSTDAIGYWPQRYHGGAVWAHDTAIAVAGLARTGHDAVAAGLVEGLLAAAADLGYRLPELHSGDARGSVPCVVPYPAACRPQAWAAASAVVLLSATLGLHPDVPAGVLRVAPMTPSPVGALHVSGLRLGGRALEVAVTADGTCLLARTGAEVRVQGAEVG